MRRPQAADGGMQVPYYIVVLCGTRNYHFQESRRNQYRSGTGTLFRTLS